MGRTGTNGDVDGVTVPKLDQLGNREIRVGATERDEDLDVRLAPRRSPNDRRETRRGAARQIDTAFEPFSSEPFLDVVKAVDAPIPLASVVEHPRLVVPGTLEGSVVGFERGPDLLA